MASHAWDSRGEHGRCGNDNLRTEGRGVMGHQPVHVSG
jgi:hypothetical protein